MTASATVLVLGRSGQLARALQDLAAAEAPGPVVFAGRERCDLREAASMIATLRTVRPTLVVNAAAYTQVEQAEREPAEAMRVNGTAVGELAHACAQLGARLIHVSTDYVFDGAASVPYPPDAHPAPLNVYGASKLDGERRIAATEGLDSLVVRTSWLYSPVGRNFLLTMLGLFRARGAASVVSDQVGSPTSAHTLARALWAAARTPGARGISHYADQGCVSWYEFALEIGAAAHRRGLLEREPRVTPIPSSDYPQHARRPAFSALDARASLAAWSVEPVPWREALGRTLDALGRGQPAGAAAGNG